MSRTTRQIRVGTIPVGGGAPVSVQSMTNTDTRDVPATLAQIRALAAAGCEIVRCAVPDRQAAEALTAIRRECPLPLVADIHFDYQLALAALAAGVDGLRLNPGNIGTLDQDALTQILLYHVVNGRRDSNDVIGSTQLRTLQGGFLRQDSGTLIDNNTDSFNANIIVTDVPASNGIIHAIDAVLLPFQL